MLAGDSSSVDLPAPDRQLPSAVGSIWQQLQGDGGDAGGVGGDAKLALLGMGLILLSQVRSWLGALAFSVEKSLLGTLYASNRRAATALRGQPELTCCCMPNRCP